MTFSVPTQRPITIRVQTVPDGANPPADPDLVLFRSGLGFFDVADSSAASLETYEQTVPAGDYIAEIYEFDHIQPVDESNPRPRTCMTITING